MHLQDVVMCESWRRSSSVLNDARQVFPDLMNIQEFTQFLVL